MYAERWKDFSDFETLKSYTKSNQFAMISFETPTCEFIPIKGLEVASDRETFYLQKGSSFIGILNHQ